ncbi:uncharacterized protein [Haliotis cracherodii]|uniref:uncharacterized protein n=1 Tax=Haliotis cracherodii TaxID=6455 RepID=UPI0039ECD2E3
MLSPVSKMASCCEIFLLFIAIVSIGSVCTKTPEQWVLEENCDSTMSFSESVILLASDLRSVEECNLVIQSNVENERLLIDITVLDLVDSCNNTSLDILDGNGNSIAGPLCKEDNAQVFKAPGNFAQFDYKSNSPNTEGKSLSITMTAFNMGIEGSCSQLDFQCDNKLCIPKDLVCNTYNECSDNSDETAVCQSTPFSTSSTSSTPTSSSTSSSSSTATSSSTAASASISTSSSTLSSPKPTSVSVSSSTAASSSAATSASTSTPSSTLSPPRPTSASPPATSPLTQMCIVGLTTASIVVKMNLY